MKTTDSKHGGTRTSTQAREAARTGAGAIPRFTEFIPADLGIDFVKLSPPMAVASAILILLAFASMFYRGGLNYGIDFAGGTMLEVRFPKATTVADVRAAVERPGLREAVVQDVGGAGVEYQIRVLGEATETESAVANAVKAGLQEKFGEGSYDVLRVETVGPKVGKELWRSATLAVIAATSMMGLYIAMRFDLAFGLGAAVALVHDVLITVGALLVTNMEFDLSTLAALLTVVGYSVHDTVIISDRIRENARKMRKEPFDKVVNLSINETMSRTIITSGTAILTTVSLFLLGGPVIHSFAFALLVGFIVGTYSSVFVATPIVMAVQRRRGIRV